MHDMDRTRAEYEGGIDALESTGFETEAFESMGEFGHEQELGNEQELSGETGLNEMQEAELASELLEIGNEQEMDRFLSKLISGAGRAIGNFAKSSTGRALGGVLKDAARAALPIAGQALGNLVLPGIGGAIGGQLASTAGSMFGLELEGLSNEDREFEVARRYVRLATSASRAAASTAARNQPRTADGRFARQIARAAVTQAARRHAPGLLRPGVLRTLRTPGGAAPVNYGGGFSAPTLPSFPSFASLDGGAPTNGNGNGYGGGYGNGNGANGSPFGGGYGSDTSGGFGPDAGAQATGGCATCGTQGASNGNGQSSAFGSPSFSSATYGGRARSGRWFRRGGKIVLVGI